MNFQGCFPCVFTHASASLHKSQNSYHVLRNPQPLLQHTVSDVSAITITMVKTGKSLLRNLLLHDFALMRLNILHHFLNLRATVRFRPIWHRRTILFGFNAIWHRQNVTTCVLCWRLAKKGCHCRSLSHVYGLIILVTQACSWYSSCFINIGFW